MARLDILTILIVSFGLFGYAVARTCYMQSHWDGIKFRWVVNKRGLCHCTKIQLGGAILDLSNVTDFIVFDEPMVSADRTTVQRFLRDHGAGVTYTDCLDAYNAGFNESKVYSILPGWSNNCFDVFCNMSDGGGWTVFQRRINGSVDFHRSWTYYKEGFGQLEHEFWLGNEKLYRLTNHGEYQLRIDLVSREGKPYYAKYDFFRINNESDCYRLSGIGKYNGTAVNSSDPNKVGMPAHLNQPFKHIVPENSACKFMCMGVRHEGGWWFLEPYCGNSNLNGKYPDEVFWKTLPGGNISFTEMSIKPKNETN